MPGQVAQALRASLKPKHAEAAQKALKDAERRYEALEQATENAADELIESGTAEADKLLEGARKVRENSVARVERAAAEIEQAVAEEQGAISVARWAQDPSRRKWKIALASGEVSRPGIRIDRLIAGAAALAPWLAQQPLPDEEAEQPRVHFGWHGGAQATG